MHLLVTARDPGAADALDIVAERAVARAGWRVTFAAMEPAATLLAKRGRSIRRLDIAPAPKADSPEAHLLLAAARDLLAEVEPDVVLTGLSSPDAGLDEALHIVANPPAAYALQDFWGDVNPVFDRHPACYFVVDAEAAALTRQRVQARCVVSGRVKECLYDTVDVVSLRRLGRSDLSVSDTTPVIGVFLQPLGAVLGYHEQWIRLADACRGLSSLLIVVRSHPKDPAGAARVAEAVRERGLAVTIVDRWEIERSLAVCDVVCTAYSSVGTDALSLARSPGKLLASVLYIMAPEVARDFAAYAGFNELPPVRQGLALAVSDDPKEIAEALAQSLSPAWRAAVTAKLYSESSSRGNAVDIILDTLTEDRARAGRLKTISVTL